jgi:hypothetical protein
MAAIELAKKISAENAALRADVERLRQMVVQSQAQVASVNVQLARGMGTGSTTR